MKPAPIVLFTYNRFDHTKKTVRALRENGLAPESDLYIYSDGPKPGDEQAVADVRVFINSVDGFKKVHIIERERNWGLADSVVEGVTSIVNTYGKVIVLEDDIVTSRYFLQYMNDALVLYENEKRVMHINGYCPPIDFRKTDEDSFFYRVTMSWGWATWQDRWNKYSDDSQTLLNQLVKKSLLDYFDIDGSFRFSSTLRANVRQEIKTWAVKWYASVTLSDGLCLNPSRSLVQNIGNDGSGTNALASENFLTKSTTENIKLKKQPVEESMLISKKIKEYYSSLKPSLLEKLVLRLQLLLKKV